jgi:hypothetical protein
MSVVELPTIYDEAFFGEPIDVPVPLQPQPLNTSQPLWTIGDWPIVVPAPPVDTTPDTQRMIADIRAWTGWSQRQLANVLCTSHTTVRNAEAGRPLRSARSGDLSRRLTHAHEVVERVFLLAGREPRATARVLEAARDAAGSATDALRAANYERAYLAAIDVLRPRSTGMLVGSRPRRSGATVPLHD